MVVNGESITALHTQFKMSNVECKALQTQNTHFKFKFERTQRSKKFRMIGIGTNDLTKTGCNLIFILKIVQNFSIPILQMNCTLRTIHKT